MRKRKRSSPQSPGSNKKMTLDPSRKDEETDFLFRSPFRPQQKAKAIQNCLKSINRDLECIKSHGLEEFTKRRASEMTEEDDDNNPAADVGKEENLGSAFDGTLRDYQIFMLERAKAENTIVHLGTGMGKTLISIMLMKDFLAREKNNSTSQAKKILFLVPSIALAVQHTDTLRANLPCKVETACHSSSNTTRAKEEIAAADVVVATHGAAIDLLTHYPEVLSLRHVSLMVMDECHYSTGGHNYATILREFYHKNLPEGERPRILGLTASPLINISVKTNAEQLQSLLSNFERIMNARLVGFPTGDGTSSTSRSDVEQAVVEYHSNETITLPNIDGWKLHPERKKEIDQLQVLCDDVGPAVTATYSRTLAREVSRNEFAEESQQQCDNLKAYLLHVASYLNQCVKEGKPGPDGHTDKMRKLEKLLNMVLRTDGGPLQESPVGIVFVEMRITAIALSNYFSKRSKEQKFDSDTKVPSNLSTEGHNDDDVFADAENDDSMDFRVDSVEAANTVCAEEMTRSRPLIRCDAAVRRKTHIFKYLSRQKVLNERHQQDLEEEWVHQTTQIRTIIRKLRNRDINLLFATSIVEEGVDVEACSFVISLDAIKNVKSYIQMKGRARQKCAKFFLFAEAGNSQPLSLNNALAVENIVHKFIAEREIEYISEYNASSINLTDCELECVEETAMHRGVYRTHVAFVDLASSKSLLNRYALSVPIDPNCRTSQRAILLHMPIYKENSLILPTHIPPDIRNIKLPQFFYEVSKKKKHSLMALAACVRLHRLGLLNDRLLPLSDADMKSWLIGIALNELPPCNVLPSLTFNTPCTVYLYKFNQHGERFNDQEKSVCNGVDRRLRLALASLNPLPNNLPSVSHCHNELGLIECSIAYIGTEVLSEYEWESLSDFHCTLFNARWRRKNQPVVEKHGESNWNAFYGECLLKYIEDLLLWMLIEFGSYKQYKLNQIPAKLFIDAGIF